MLSALANVNPLYYIVLLAFAFVARLPSFNANYFATDESVYMLIGRQLADGGTMYIDAWDHKPPVIHWFYAAFVYLFNDGALTAIRVFTCFYVFLGSLLVNGLLIQYRVVSDRSVLPAFLYILAVSVPWYALEMNAELLMSVPMLWSFGMLAYNYIEDKREWSNAFFIGALCALCVAIKYQGALHFAAILIAYVLIAPARLADIITMVGGFLLTILGFFLLFYFNRSFYEFLDIGLLYNLDYVRFKPLPGQSFDIYGIFEYFKIWGPMIVFATFGFLAMRARSYGMSIKERKMEIAMTWWLILGGVAVILGGSRFYLHYFIYVIPAMIFYLADYFHKLKKNYQYVLSMSACMLAPLFFYASYFVVLNPDWYAKAKPYVTVGGWAQNTYYNLHGTEQERLLREDIARYGVKKGIFIAHFLPELYLKLGQPCSMKYANFGMAYNKMNWLSHNFRNSALLSNNESIADLHRLLEDNPPEYVIDPLGVFGEWLEKMPLLPFAYDKKKVGEYTVYTLRRPAKSLPF